MKPFILIVGLSLLLVSPAFPTDFYVSGAGSDSNPGTQSQPFATIQHAFNATTSQSSATIHLDASTWNESPSATDKYLSLIGDYAGPNGLGSRTTTHINGTISLTYYQEPAISMSLSVKQLTIQRIYCSMGTMPYLGISLSVENCDILNSPQSGISCSASDRGGCSVSNCYIANATENGINISAACDVDSNTVVNCGRNGIFISPNSLNWTYNNYIQNNIVSGCGASGIVWYVGSNGAYITDLSNNTSSNNNDFGLYIYAAPSSRVNVVMNNKAFSNGADGININGSGAQLNFHLSGNICAGNHWWGMSIEDIILPTTPYEITNNTFGSYNSYPGNTDGGIYIRSNSPSSIFLGNNISGNLGDGIALESTTLRFEKNLIQNNQSYGVYILGSGGNPDLGGGALGSRGHNNISGNGTYDLYKTGTNNTYVKYNHWDSATEQQMASGNQKRTNIVRFYDVFDYWQPGDPLSGAFIWDPNFAKNDKLEFKTNKVEVKSLGQVKASYK